MITMEFEEMKKIWDTQKHRPLYAIDEDALRRRIQLNSHKASRASNVNEIALILISLVTFGIVLIKNWSDPNPWAFPPVIALLVTSVFIYIGRRKRLKKALEFDRTMMGELDHALYNMNYEIKRARTFPMWYIFPVMIPSFLNMYMNDAALGKWLFVIGAFILSYFVVWLGLSKFQKPQHRKLVELREKIKNDDWGDDEA